MTRKGRTGRQRGLVVVLIRSFAAFGIALALSLVGVYLLWDHLFQRALSGTDVYGLVQDERLAQGRYAAAFSSHGVGMDADVAVFDAEADLVYANADWEQDLGSWAHPTAGEMACMEEWDGDTWTDVSRLVVGDGEDAHYLLTRYVRTVTASDEEIVLGDGDTASVVYDLGQSVAAQAELDADLNVVSGSLNDGHTAYTQREFNLLRGKAVASGALSRLAFTSDDGQELTLVVYYKPVSAQYYDRLAAQANLVWFLLVPLVGGAGALLVWRLDRSIRRPLERLDRAVGELGGGRDVHVATGGGDIREVARVAQTLEQTARALAASEAQRKREEDERRRMLAGISHDLKTPVTTIAGYAQALDEGLVPEGERASYLAAIRAKSAVVAELVDNLHQFNTVDHPDYTLRRRRTDVCEYVRAYVGARYDELVHAGFAVDADICEEALFCQIDDSQMRRALNNLVDNALAYNPTGTTLRVAVEPAGAMARVTLADDGRGLGADARTHVFDAFWRGDASRPSDGGSGLGLTVARRVVEAHGGRIALEPEGARWKTAFVIELPLDTVPRKDGDGEARA